MISLSCLPHPSHPLRPCCGSHHRAVYLLFLTLPMPKASPYLLLFDLSTTFKTPSFLHQRPPPCPSPHGPCRSLSTLGKSPGCVFLLRPPSALTVGELRGATKRDTCQLSRQTKQVLYQRLEEGQLSIRPAAPKHWLQHIWPLDQGLTDWQPGWWWFESTLLTLNWPELHWQNFFFAGTIICPGNLKA